MHLYAIQRCHTEQANLPSIYLLVATTISNLHDGCFCPMPEPRPVSSRPLQQLDAQMSGQWWGTEEPHALRHLPVEPSLQPHRPRRADVVDLVKAMAKRDLPRLKGKRHQRNWEAICGHWHQHASSQQNILYTCVMIIQLKDSKSWVISPLKIRREKNGNFHFPVITL